MVKASFWTWGVLAVVGAAGTGRYPLRDLVQVAESWQWANDYGFQGQLVPQLMAPQPPTGTHIWVIFSHLLLSSFRQCRGQSPALNPLGLLHLRRSLF